MSKATKQGQLDAGGRPASWGQAGAARGVCGVEGSAGGQLGGAGLADSVRGDVVACRRAGAWGEDGARGSGWTGSWRRCKDFAPKLALVGLSSPSYSDIH